MELIIYPSYQQTHFSYLEELEDSLAERKLIYYASSLLNRGFDDPGELEDAISKACTAISIAGKPVHHHFRKVFIAGDHDLDLQYDWLVSDLGMKMIILNADASNPLIANLKLKVADRF